MTSFTSWQYTEDEESDTIALVKEKVRILNICMHRRHVIGSVMTCAGGGRERRRRGRKRERKAAYSEQVLISPTLSLELVS